MLSSGEAYQSQIDALQTRSARVGPDPTTNTLEMNTNRILHIHFRVSWESFTRSEFCETYETASRARVARCTLDARARRAINAVMRCERRQSKVPNPRRKPVSAKRRSAHGWSMSTTLTDPP